MEVLVRHIENNKRLKSWLIGIEDYGCEHQSVFGRIYARRP